MSDTTHLLIPYAASASPGCQQALQGLALPHLDRLLARLSPHALPPGHASPEGPAHLDVGEDTSFSPPHERALARALGLPTGDGRIPWAAWHRHQQGLPADGQGWAFFTPCQWQVSTDHITLRDPAALGLDETASRALLAIVAPWCEQDGITLHYDQPTRWLARSALFAELSTASLERVLERDVRVWMPDARQARTLHRLHSEIQMLLYTHAFNDERAARGEPAVNSLWVHGTGTLPADVAARPAPTDSTALPGVVNGLRQAALQEDWRSWARAWEALDAGAVASLLHQAESGAPVRLTVCGERSAAQFHSARRSLGQRIQSVLRPCRFIHLQSML